MYSSLVQILGHIVLSRAEAVTGLGFAKDAGGEGAGPETLLLKEGQA